LPLLMPLSCYFVLPQKGGPKGWTAETRMVACFANLPTYPTYF
jgi:hypothetical protein